MQTADSRQAKIHSIERLSIRRKYSKALRKCEAALRAIPGDRELQVKRLELLAALQRGGELRRIATEAIGEDPQFAEAQLFLGYAEFLEQRTKTAIRLYCKALELKPSLREANIFLAEAYIDEGHVDLARNLVETEIENVGSTFYNFEYVGVLIAIRAQIESMQWGPEAGRASIITEIKKRPWCRSLIEALREYNHPATAKTRLYMLEVAGSMSARFGELAKDGSFYGSFDVAADSDDEALGYIREVVAFAEPASLKITAKRKKRNNNLSYTGVVEIYPSFSVAAPDAQPLSQDHEGFSPHSIN